MDAETGFIIDGARYEVPTLDTFGMDEAQVLYDYSGCSIEDFVPLAEPPPLADDADADVKSRYEEAVAARDDELVALDKKLRNPGFLRALIHVAYQRANPRLSPARVKETVGAADYGENWLAFIEGPGEDDALPPALTTEPATSSPPSSVSNPDSSGTSSMKLSAVPEDPPTPTTTGESATSSASALTVSAG